MAAILRKVENLIADAMKVAREVKIMWPGGEVMLDLRALAELRADADEVGITVERCFTRRRLYTMDFGMEQPRGALQSAIEIRDMLDERANSMSGKGGEHRALLHLVSGWATSANSLRQVLEDRLRDAPDMTWVKDDPQSTQALTHFRCATLPIIAVLIAQTEGDIRARAEDTYAKAMDLLSARDVVTIGGAFSCGT